MKKFTIVETVLELETENGLKRHVVPRQIAIEAKVGSLEERARKRGYETAYVYLEKWSTIRDYFVQYFNPFSKTWEVI